MCIFRSKELNNLVFKAVLSVVRSANGFNTDSKLGIIDCGASSAATTDRSNFIEGMYKYLSGVTISGITSGIESSRYGSILLSLKVNDGKSFGIQIDKILHLKELPMMLISPQ